MAIFAVDRRGALALMTLLVIGLLVLVLVPGVLATQPGEDGPEETFIVTASRLPQAVEEVPAAVAVITYEEAVAAGATTLTDALALGANVAVRANSDALATVNLQGATSSQVQVQVNGRPVNPGASSSVDLSLMPLEDVERIEIVKGPASALYGANAIGGVVNIITRKPNSANPKTVVTTNLGAADEKRVTVSSEGGVGSTAFTLTAGNAGSDGARANSDFSHQTLSGSLEWDAYAGRIALTTRYAARTAGSPGGNGQYGNLPTPLARQEDQLLNADLSYATDGDSPFAARIHSDSNSVVYDDPDDPWGSTHTETDSQERGVELRRTVSLGSHRLVFGGEYSHSEADSTYYSKLQSADNVAVYVEDLFETDSPLSLTLGGRFDKNSRYREVFSPRAAAVYSLSDHTRVWGAVGQAFRAPSFNDLYWGGARDLDPEIATSYQTGFTAGPFDLTLYHKYVLNYIKWSQNPALGAANVTSRFNGAEASYRWKIGRATNLDLAYAWVDAVRESDDSKLTDVPRTQLSATLQIVLPKDLTLLTRVYHQSDQLTNDYTDVFNPVVVTAPGFTTLDCTVTRQLSKTLSWQVRLENALDVQYQKVPGYPMPGRTISAGATFSF